MRAGNKRTEGLVYALAFLLPAGVMLWVCAALGMAPWGDRTILMSDMSSQYVEFFCALKSGDLFFSWSKALGTSYIGVFSYYVSSPLSFLTLFVPNEAMPVGLMLLVVLKIGLAGLSFAIFAQKRFPGANGAGLLGAVCYALMSYNVIYSICVMWLDGVIWLPLILLALERILAGKGAGPFIAALTVCFFSTWYISYMVGAFCALYLCARLIALKLDGRALKGVLVRFFGGAACALGLTAWMWLPTLLAMFNGKFSGGSIDYDGLLACDPLELLHQLRGGQFHSIGYDAPPYIFCGTAALVLAVFFFFLREFPRRERLASAGLLAAVAASMVLSPLDKAWHLFQRPNWFPFRYSFVFSFVVVYLAVQAFGPLLSAFAERGVWVRRGVALALTALSVVQLSVNAKTILSGMERQFSSASYWEYQKYYRANAQLTQAAEEDAGGRFYRMGATEDRGHNSPLSFGYPGITHYSSLYNYDVNQTLKGLGFAQAWMWCAYYGSTPVTDALFGIEYVISRDEMPGYEPLAQAGGLTLWKSPDRLPLAFCPEAIDETLRGDTPFDRQNDLLSCLSGNGGPVFTPAPAVVDAGEGETVLYLVGTGKPLYMDLSAGSLREVLVNGRQAVALGTSEAASVHYLGTPPQGEGWTISVRHSGGWTGQLWELDQDGLHQAAEGLARTARVTSVDKDGRVRIAVQDEDAGGLVATIPAEDGWTAYVDGRKVETGSWLGTFLYVELPAGAREVELRYTAPGLAPGIALGALSAAALVLAWGLPFFFEKKKEKR